MESTGAITVSAVEQFQRENALIVDGITGHQTWTALCNTLPIVSSPPLVPIEEICGDGFDNNFDGTIDENCENPEITPTNETVPLR